MLNNVAKAAPSPAPTTAVPTISAVPTIDVCSTVGESTTRAARSPRRGRGRIPTSCASRAATVRAATRTSSCPEGFDIWVPRSYAHALAVLEATDWRDVSWPSPGLSRRRLRLGGDYLMNSDAMATQRRRLAKCCRGSVVHAVVGLSRAKRRLRSRLLAWHERLDDQRGLRVLRQLVPPVLLDVPVLDEYRKAAPSPAPTITPGPTDRGAHGKMCSSSGEFEYEGRTLYCVEAAGEIRVLPVNYGQSTCRYTDENSCPAGFDIRVLRSYEHLEAVYNLARDWWPHEDWRL